MSPRPFALLHGRHGPGRARPAHRGPGPGAVTPSTPCVRYVPGVDTWTVSGFGFSPTSAVSIAADGQLVGSGLTDGAGRCPPSR